MYWILNFAPMIIEIVINSFAYFNENNNGNTMLAVAWVFVIVPIYLVILNCYYINKKSTTFVKSILLIAFIFVIRVLYMIILHKIKYGEFIGDVPVGIYSFLAITPIVIVLVGMLIYYLRKGK